MVIFRCAKLGNHDAPSGQLGDVRDAKVLLLKCDGLQKVIEEWRFDFAMNCIFIDDISVSSRVLYC